ncbi:hypothetical protein ACIQMR_35475 [Streptomyces sp. NPDC091376]|uniref:hypothetical protein n=1 Tax=Streptomyces sp. NPDC091376 TaxID=3365994 RepID=UPI0037FEF7FC
METIPTAEDIKGRRVVRFSAGHLAEHTNWTGVLVGYNTLYDTVHVYVDAPGNSESGSKITYSRKDVEWFDPKAAEEVAGETVQYRETTITVAGVAHVVRTERTGTVKQLEAAHTKAVKATIVDARRANLPTFIAAAEAAELKAKKSPGSWLLKEAAKDARNIVRRAERGTCHSHTSPWAASLKPLPKVRFTAEIPSYLVEVAPGHYATEEAAEQLTIC